MAKELSFTLGGATFSAAPVKLERKKIYGWSTLVATDREGNLCIAAYISPEDSLMANKPDYGKKTSGCRKVSVKR